MQDLVAFAAETENGHGGGEATHAEVGHEAGGHEGGGLPQMDTSTYASQVFWLAITFTFLYLFLSRAVLPKIGQVIEERRDRIASDLDKAADLQSKSEKALEAYEGALADARAKAHTLANETRERLTAESDARKAAVEAELSSKLAEADAKIAETKESALASIKDVANETAAVVVEHLIGETADAGAIQAAVDAELSARKG
ncbi:MAG: F0F1 ATP synthase subunit B [Alphaproteobacteria bacterium]|nr:MAG: F0F1 ATP synthase subunit B [Alphaproteobacteria bacterium]